jgi:hypothetical protein
MEIKKHITPEDTTEVYFGMSHRVICYIIATSTNKKLYIYKETDKNKLMKEIIRYVVEDIVSKSNTDKIRIDAHIHRSAFDFSGINKDIEVSHAHFEDPATIFDSEHYWIFVELLADYYGRGEFNAKSMKYLINEISDVEDIPEEIIQKIQNL